MTRHYAPRSTTSFVGRRREKEEVRRLLQRSRLVTVLGPGGVGKTRLAEETALQTARAFQDSVCFVDLAPVRNPSAVAASAAAALAVSEHAPGAVIEDVVEALRDQQILLVIDNCEHLVESVGHFVTAVLSEAPQVRVLATSREPLRIGGEFTYLLPPLSLPAKGDRNQTRSLAESEAVALFIERGQAVIPEFQICPANSDSIAQLCIELDGIPLAIELAAVRLRSLSPLQLVHRLRHRFSLLAEGDRTARPRQQTLRAVVDWSFDLCSEAERGLWARLAVFPGSFDLEAAEAVCGYGDIPPEQVFDLLDSLVAKSLVIVDRSSEQLRYSQLITLREYGRELLDRSGAAETIGRRHRDHYLERSEQSVQSKNWFSPTQSDLATSWRMDHHNLTAALEWSVAHHETTAAARLAVALRYHWLSDGVLHEARLRLDELLAQLRAPTRERGDVLWVTAWVALIQGDRDSARLRLSECSDIATELCDAVLHAHHDHVAALLALFCGNTTEAIDLYERAIGAYRSTGELPETLNALFQLAIAQIYAGRPEASLQSCADLIHYADTHHEQWNKAYALWVSSIANFHLGRTNAAVDAAKKALRIQLAFEDQICTALAIEVLAWTAEAVGDIRGSARLFGAAGFAWEGLGTSVAAFGPGITSDSLQSQERVRKSLGDKAFEALSAPPPGLTLSGTIHLALDDETVAEAAETESSTFPLTPREVEVATLVAEGLRNRQIAAQLVISPRTVEGHVERILNKLELRSRAQLGTWVQKHSS
ncbi:AAA family ATPase [Nocardia elegans]|uniref:ATP-binding protein n=1 Tax=Nocardia elegans TaxID=300029 RepID=UPI001893A06B|nr:LuxR C-terminal-related transcriptional regulator [Nocardia elegans]MBF6451100.1 AAA family ATPase [Nocardia elegans]